MKTTHSPRSTAHRCVGGVIAACCALCALPAFAQAPAPAATYQKDREQCLSGATHQSRQDCLKEAQSALGESRKGNLAAGDPKALDTNRMQRCQVQPEGEARVACEALARGEGNASGTPQSGGVVKEITTVVPAQQPPVPAVAPTTPTTPATPMPPTPVTPTVKPTEPTPTTAPTTVPTPAPIAAAPTSATAAVKPDPAVQPAAPPVR